jgi:hypothetical protein
MHGGAVTRPARFVFGLFALDAETLADALDRRPHVRAAGDPYVAEAVALGAAAEQPHSRQPIVSARWLACSPYLFLRHGVSRIAQPS